MAKKGQNKTPAIASRKRGTGRQFEPGNQVSVGHGRPPGTTWKSTLIEIGQATELRLSLVGADGEEEYVIIKAEEGKNLAQMVGAKLFAQALAGDVRAAQLIMERCEGRPVQPIEGGNTPITLIVPERFLPELPDE